MNKEAIMKMEPGREMDELVMTTLFGARRATYGDEERWHHYDENGEPDYEWNFYNSPSTDIAAAWEVLDTLGYARVTRRHSDVYWCEIMNARIQTEGATAPEAICRAALLAAVEGWKP